MCNGHTIGKGTDTGQDDAFTRLQCCVQARRVLRLDTDDSYLGHQVFDIGCDARDQTAATDRNENRIQRALMLTQDFHRDSALPGNDVRIVKRRNKGTTGFARKVQRIGQRKREALAMQDRVGAPTADSEYLQLRCRTRHDDARIDSQLPCGQRHALSMVAGRGRHHTASLLRIAQLHELVVGTPNLEGKGGLQIFALEQDLVAQYLRQCVCTLQRRAHSQLVHWRRKDLFDVVLQQGLLFGCAIHIVS
ncbi:hypothetical protein D3C84_810610 [compost metagenome]